MRKKGSPEHCPWGARTRCSGYRARPRGAGRVRVLIWPRLHSGY